MLNINLTNYQKNQFAIGHLKEMIAVETSSIWEGKIPVCNRDIWIFIMFFLEQENKMAVFRMKECLSFVYLDCLSK